MSFLSVSYTPFEGYCPEWCFFSQATLFNTIPAVQILDVNTGLSQSSYLGHNHDIHAVAWAPDGKRVASAGDDSTVQIWDAANAQTLLVYRGQSPKFKNGVDALK